MTRNSYAGQAMAAVRLVRSKARRLSGGRGFQRADREDLEQELMMDLERRLRKFDPERLSLRVFINSVLNHKVANLKEARNAMKRNCLTDRISRMDFQNREDEEQIIVIDDSWQMTVVPMVDFRVDFERCLTAKTGRRERVHLPVLGPDERPRPRLHDKVIQLKNDYTLDIMNGAGGVVTKVADNGTLTIDFDGNIVEIAPKSTKWNHIQLAYALSIHRSQGSEFPCAVVLMHKSHAFMHHRNLFYTAVTRAKESVLIIGDRWGIQNCARKHYTETRKTALSFLLQERRNIAADP